MVAARLTAHPNSTAWITPVHDRAGNMTTVPKPSSLADGLTCTYDAWNRLVEVKDGNKVVAQYEYDGLNRRVLKRVPVPAQGSASGGGDEYETDYYFHNAGWQVLETRRTDQSSASPDNLQPRYQYVWSARYIDAPILRDKNTDQDNLCDDQRLYYLTDANFDFILTLSTWCPGQAPTRSRPGYFRRTVPVEQLHPVATLVDEQEQPLTKRIAAEVVDRQSPKPVNAFSHVGRLHADVDFHRQGEAQHDPPSNAASTSRSVCRSKPGRYSDHPSVAQVNLHAGGGVARRHTDRHKRRRIATGRPAADRRPDSGFA